MQALRGEGPILDAGDELPRVRRDRDTLQTLGLGAEGIGGPPGDFLDLVVDQFADTLEDLVLLGGVELLAGGDEAIVDGTVPRISLELCRLCLLAAEVYSPLR